MKNVEETMNHPLNIKIEEFIDELYERKKEGERLDQYQDAIFALLGDFTGSV